MSSERSPAPTARPPAACSEKRCHSSAARSGFRATCRKPRCGACVHQRREDGQLRPPQLRAARPCRGRSGLRILAAPRERRPELSVLGSRIRTLRQLLRLGPRCLLPEPPLLRGRAFRRCVRQPRRTRGPFRSQAVGDGKAGDAMLPRTSSSSAARTGPPPPRPVKRDATGDPFEHPGTDPVGPSSSGRSERGRSDSRSGHSLDHSCRSLPLPLPMSRSGRSDMVPPALRRSRKLARESGRH
jgi:hypothetical protein